MSISKITKNYNPPTKEIVYLNKTFSDFRQNLINFAKVYYPNTYNDFNESSPGMMFIEMAAYVGDVLSFYIDDRFKENLLEYAQEQQNIITIAQAYGYKPRPGTAASTTADFFQLVPSQGSGSNYAPDPRYFLLLDANAVVASSQYGTVNFRTTDQINFADPTNQQITVYSVDSNNTPLTYLVQKQVPIEAGDIKTVSYTFGNPQKFSTIVLPDANVLGILSIVDSNGFIWNEVDYLAQDVVFVNNVNTNPVTGSTTVNGNTQSVPPQYILSLQQQPRRFVTRYNTDFQLEIQFGSGVISDTDESVSLDVNKVASTEYQSRLGSTPLDPADFLGSTSYGLAPSNVTMTITYVVGGGVESNVPTNTINQVKSISVLNDTAAYSTSEQALFQTTVASVAVNNPDAATGGLGVDSVEEIRQNALAFFNAQNRLVSVEDYTVRCYAMPPIYGGVAKVFVIQDEQINSIVRTTITGDLTGQTFVTEPISPNSVNIYLLGYDINGNLTTLNDQTKQNLQSYLSQYKIVTDQINLMDGFIVNIGVNFRIVVFKNYNMNDVLARCLDAVKSFFDISNWQIGQPIILNDLNLTIAQVDGVQSLLYANVVNKYGFQDGPNYADFIYDIGAATDNGIVYPSLDPCIFEVAFPDTDIVGSALQ